MNAPPRIGKGVYPLCVLHKKDAGGRPRLACEIPAPGDVPCPVRFTCSPPNALPELDEEYYVLTVDGEIWRAIDGRKGVIPRRAGRWV